MKKQWRDLTNLAGNILEYVDITKRDLNIKLGAIVETRFIKQELDKQTVDDILEWQYTKEADGCYSAKFVSNILCIKFIKTGF